MVARPLHFSPKQVSTALGVSESSVKRWCDQGVIPTIKTVGGHRKITREGLADFLSRTGRELNDPQLIGLRTLPSAPIPGASEENRVAFREALAKGNESVCRQILHAHIQRGSSRSDAVDYFITDAMYGIGEAWDCRQLDVYQERYACNSCIRLIDELRAQLPAAKDSAPVAIGGTPEGDPYQLPTAMVELALREIGWNAINLGSNLPIDSFLQAARDLQPQLVWLSVSSIAAQSMFIAEQNRLAAELDDNVVLLVGGRGLTDEIRPRLRYTAHCDSIRSVIDLANLMSKNKQPS
jgi:MerR family transcriptional regulator, light-induced transcriptional regulator